MTLFGEYLGGHHRPIHKWHQYFPVYEQHFERFRNRHVTIFEIGVGEGGSLQLWRGYFGPFATIVGIGCLSPVANRSRTVRCRYASAARPIAFLASLVAEFGPPDIVIDDGSHLQADINATFDFLYPQVAKKRRLSRRRPARCLLAQSRWRPARAELVRRDREALRRPAACRLCPWQRDRDARRRPDDLGTISTTASSYSKSANIA